MYPCKASLFLAPINDEAIHERYYAKISVISILVKIGVLRTK